MNFRLPKGCVLERKTKSAFGLFTTFIKTNQDK